MGAIAASASLASPDLLAAGQQLRSDRKLEGVVRAPGFPEFQTAPQASVITGVIEDYRADTPLLRPERWYVSDRPQTAPQDAPPVLKFDIPSGTFGDVLEAYQRIAGVTVTLSDESIRTLSSPGVSGSLTAEQALQQILTGTGIKYRFVSPQSIALDIAGVSESLEVSGGVPRVSSPKYPTTLRETPQTVQVITRDVIEQQGATTLSDALRNVPGITMQAGEGGGASSTAGDMFNMRGFNASNSLFVDGVRDDGLIARDVFNLEQVEVYSGPTGSDVGRGTASGYINMATKTPRALPRYGAAFAFGSADQRRFQADVNQPLGPGNQDSWWGGSAFRLNALVQDSGVPGRDLTERESRGLAPALTLGLNSHVRVTAQGQFMRQDNLPDYGIPGAAWQDGPLTPTGVVAPGEVRQANFYGALSDHDEVSQDSYTGRLEVDVNPNLTLRNQTRYNKTHRSAVITSIGAYNATTQLVSSSRQANERENSIVSNQTNVGANVRTGRLSHALRGGVEFTSEEQFAPTIGGVGTRVPVDIYHPDLSTPIVGFALGRTGAFTDGQSNTQAVYVFDSVDLASRWQVTGGVRFEHYTTEFLSVDALSVRTADLDASDNLFSGKVGLLFKATDTGNLYVSYGTTKTPPGSANFQLSAQENNANNPNVDPQTSTNLEVGTKWDVFGSRLSLTGAVFHTKNENVIFTVDGNAVPPLFNYDDAQEVNGVAMGAAGRITDRWSVTASLAYLDSENLTQNATNAGRRLTLTPKVSGSVWTSYQFPFGLMVGGGIRHTDKVFVNAANTIVVPSYQLVDLVAQYDITRHFAVRVNVNNATDELYIRNINNNGGRYNPGNPRSGLITLVANY
jgi:catecholate siderophore receptor